tara:strand:+ start:407 stop:700 length:294 start_codon:yes stop_codon:yes gene_type:complete
MPRGNIYYGKVDVSYRSGRDKDRKMTQVNVTMVGYDFDDATSRLVGNPDKVIPSLLKKAYTNKVRDVLVVDAEMLFKSGKTMYDIDTGRVIKPNRSI